MPAGLGRSAALAGAAAMVTGSHVRLHNMLPHGVVKPSFINLDACAVVHRRVSCVMATRGHEVPARQAIQCFQRQTHPDRELVIACATAGSDVEALVRELDDPQIRFAIAEGAANVGDIRNAAIAQADGELVCVWDDDDLSHPDRLRWQLAAMAAADAPIAALSRVLLWWPATVRLAMSVQRVWENTLLVERAIMPPYPSVERGGDTTFFRALRKGRAVALLEQPEAYIYVAHGANIWGADHFEMLFGHADRLFAGEECRREIARRAADIPMADYVRLMDAAE